MSMTMGLLAVSMRKQQWSDPNGQDKNVNVQLHKYVRESQNTFILTEGGVKSGELRIGD